MTTTRGRILQVLQRKKGATADELARELGLAAASVRRHLDVLQREAEITYTEVRRSTGRPHFRYALTERGQSRLPQSSHTLASQLLKEITSFQPQEIRGRSGREMLDLALARAAREMVATYAHRFTQTSLKGRVGALSQLLTDHGFMSEWQEEDDGYRLMVYHCPYYPVAVLERQVCDLDEHFVGGILKVPVTRVTSLLSGDICCAYRVEKEG